MTGQQSCRWAVVGPSPNIWEAEPLTYAELAQRAPVRGDLSVATMGAAGLGADGQLLCRAADTVVAVSERCLVGANAGAGISLGDDCVIEAGTYITAGTKVTLPDGRVVKARELSGVPGLLFLRHSTTGTAMARPRLGQGITVNPALHANG